MIDTLFKKGDGEQNQVIEQTGPKNILNYRDHLGRTALHLAVAVSNKEAVETLLYLGANPHVADVFN